MKSVLTDSQVLHYIDLVDRRVFIIMHSGIDWKPEYEQELAEIDREISSLRRLIDSVEGQDSEVQKPEETEDSSSVLDTYQVSSQEEDNGNTMTVVQAMEKASKYDFQALKRSFPSMSIIQIVQEIKEVIQAYAVLQQQPERVFMDCVRDDFSDALLFLGDFAMDYLTHIFFN